MHSVVLVLAILGQQQHREYHFKVCPPAPDQIVYAQADPPLSPATISNIDDPFGFTT